jgi:hypothetical protein
MTSNNFPFSDEHGDKNPLEAPAKMEVCNK